MMIRPDQIEGVQPEQSQRKDKAKQPGNAFGDILNQEVARGDAPAGAQGVVPPPIVNPLIATGAVDRARNADPVVGQVESILDKWDSYAATLSDPNAGLKSAYGALEDVAGQVAALREQPGLAQSHPDLKAIVDELEAMTVTEQVKFNRGDYV